jgi:hypothetical protein
MALALAVLCGLALIAWTGAGESASAAAPREWILSGSLTGTYSNDMTWINCVETGATGTSRERVNVNATLSGGRPAPYEGTGLFLAARWHPGGAWRVTGSNPVRHEQPDGSVTCGAPQPFHCGGPLRGGGAAAATIFFQPRGKVLAGNFSENDFIKEGDNPCPSIESMSGGTGPLFGLADTAIEPDAFFENGLKPGSLVIPRARLEGRRAFSIRHSVGPDGGCARRSEYTRCTQSGRLTLTLRFRPGR